MKIITLLLSTYLLFCTPVLSIELSPIESLCGKYAKNITNEPFIPENLKYPKLNIRKILIKKL